MDRQGGPMSLDMQFELPKEKTCICSTCRYRKPDDVFHEKDGRTVIIAQWRSSECKFYEDKPSEVLFNNAPCEYCEKGKASAVFQPNWS